MAMLAHTPAAQAWAICRSTNSTGPARRRSRQRIAPQVTSPTVHSTRYVVWSCHVRPRHHLREQAQDEHRQAVPHPQHAPVLQHLGVVRLAEHPRRGSSPARSAGSTPPRRPGTPPGRRPARRPWGSAAPAASAGTSGRSAPGRGRPVDQQPRAGPAPARAPAAGVDRVGRLERRPAGEHSYRIAPSAYTSAAGVRSLRPVACSGAM